MMKKIISLFSALAVVATMMASFTTTSFAVDGIETEKRATAIVGEVVDVDGDGYAIMQFKLTHNETFVDYSVNRGKHTVNGVAVIQAVVNLDPTVFDVSETYISGNTAIKGAGLSGDNTQQLKYGFTSTTPDTILTSVPEYVFQIDALLNDGYTKDNIPSSAISFEDVAVRFINYNDSKTKTNDTIYGYETATFDYPITLEFAGETLAGGSTGGETVTPVAMDAGVEVAEGPYKGMTTVSAPEAVAVKDFTKITVTNDKDTSKTLEWTAPTTLGNGGSKVLPVLVFDKVATANSKFTITLWNVTTAVKIFEHAVTE